jgi:hypothetical protein
VDIEGNEKAGKQAKKGAASMEEESSPWRPALSPLGANFYELQLLTPGIKHKTGCRGTTDSTAEVPHQPTSAPLPSRRRGPSWGDGLLYIQPMVTLNGTIRNLNIQTTICVPVGRLRVQNT